MDQDMVTFVAPVTLVLGAGLFAAGALSFLDIHFFKIKFGERAALAGGLVHSKPRTQAILLGRYSVRYSANARAAKRTNSLI